MRSFCTLISNGIATIKEVGIIRALLLTLLFLPIRYSQAQEVGSYQIDGEVKGLANGTKLYLINGNRRKIIDSAVVEHEQFTLRGHLLEPAHMYLHAERGKHSKKLADILLDNQVIYIRGGAPVYDSITVNGSMIDRQWKEWMKEDEYVARQRFQLKQISQSLLGNKYISNANALNKIIDELQAVRVGLLKSYVKRYYNTAAGAALPTLCTLGDSLTGNDYMEMYNTLSPPWQQSSFGKEIIRQAVKKGRVSAVK